MGAYPPQGYGAAAPPAPAVDTRGRTIVVAASNSIDPTLAPVAYRCNGIDDQVEINAAVTALGATGGTVMLLEGQYNITASINLATLTTLMGQGAGTVLRIPDAFNADLNVIFVINADHIIVADLRIDGNKANQAAGDMNGIYFDTVTYSMIERCWVENIYGVTGIFLIASSDNTVTGNNCQSNDNVGIYLNASSNGTVTGNNVQSNGQEGIYLDTSSNNTITGNNVQSNGSVGIALSTSDNNTVTGNNCQSNIYGIALSTSDNNTVTGNNCQSNGGQGIRLDSSSNNNAITGNNCQSNGAEGINLDASNNNTVAGNTVVGNSQTTDNAYDGILIDANSDYNNVQGNTVRHDGGANQHRYGINIAINTCDGNLVISNDLYLAGRTLDYNDAGTLTVYHNNRLTAGWVP